MVRQNSKTQIISPEDSIRKSNELSMSKLNQGLTLNQMQLLAYSIYCTQKNGVTEFHKIDFEKKFSTDQYRTEDAKKDSRRILSLQVGLEDLENDSFEYWNVFRKMKYVKGLFRFTWTEEMIPHILELKEKYITTDLTIASKFRSSFSWILYDFIKAHHGYWHKPISKEALTKLFGVEKVASYKSNTSLFKKYVLDVAIEEVNEHTELKVWYKVEKEGRSIVGFDLIWSNGKTVVRATKKQIKELRYITNIIFEDMLEYINLNNEDNRQRAIELVRTTEEMKIYLDGPICITAEKADFSIQKANASLGELEQMLAAEREPKPQFYNWLEERE